MSNSKSIGCFSMMRSLVEQPSVRENISLKTLRKPKLSEMATTTDTSTELPSVCFLHSESEDEESFVVLCRSLPPDSLVQDSGNEAVEPIQANAVQESLKLATSGLLQLSSSSLPSIPKVNEQDLVVNVPESSVNVTTANSSADLSPDEVQQKLDMLIEENMKLKETLHQNNLAMKKQYEMLVLWQEDVMIVHQSHKEKFAETKKYIDTIKRENIKLTEALRGSQIIEFKLKEELQMLKTEINEIRAAKEKAGEGVLKTSLDKEYELGAAKMKITELEQHINNLQKEKLEFQKKGLVVDVVEDEVQILQKKLAKAEEACAQISIESNKRLQEADTLQKVLLDEIKMLKDQLRVKAQPEVPKEPQENIQEQLMAAQMHITKLELMKNEDKETINAKEEQITKLQNFVKEMTESIDTITALRTQLELYKSDFEAERQAKESVRAEKEQIADDLQNLQRRNQQLLEEVERLRGGDFVHVNRPDSRSSTASAPQDGWKYQCPKCNFKFRDYQALENHVYRCIEIDNLF